MRFLSVCSGIEAASVAWQPLGWSAVAFSEIEPFPCAVLKHHYPDIPNWGDMTQYQEWPDAPINLLCGGTPCQSFSVAGLRKGLADPRGNLMLTFGAIAAKYRPQWLVWENVPGVLSSNKGRDFGAFLGMLGQLGYGFAYRVLDAQYFGVAQRRRRVFVVAHLGDWRRAAAVLFERHSLSGDTAPSREAGQAAAARAGAGAASRGWPASVTGTLDTSFGPKQGLDDQHVNAGCPLFVPGQVSYGIRTANTSSNGWGIQEEATHTLDGAMGIAVAHSLRGEGFDASEDGTGRGTPLVPVSYAIQAGALRTNPASGPDGMGVQADRAYTLEARAEVQAVAVALRGREGGATAELGDKVQNCLRASSGGGDKPHVLVFDPIRYGDHQQDTLHHESGVMSSLPAGSNNNGGHYTTTVAAMQVRRLTPRECERLQGFPDDWTLIPWRKKPASECPDGPRYKALGNSWAVPVARWIGKRIEQQMKHEAIYQILNERIEE